MVRAGSAMSASLAASLVRYSIQYVTHAPVCKIGVVTYSGAVPKLWSETIEGHRHEVREAILDATADLVAQHGLLSVTMSRIAEKTGIGRATLYKYFSDVESILLAWHDREIAGHLQHLTKVRDQAVDAAHGLHTVLMAYALICQQSQNHQHTELGIFLHHAPHITRAQQQLSDMVLTLVSDGVAAGFLRDDVAPDELANYCLRAVTAAVTLPTEAAVRRLVMLTLNGMGPPVKAP